MLPPDTSNRSRPSRRSLLKNGSVLLGASAVSLVAPFESAKAADAPPSKPLAADCAAQNTVAMPIDLVVPTTAGAVRGYLNAGIATFKGIPYGDVSERFMPPKPAAPWTGTRSCLSYGSICPQPAGPPQKPTAENDEQRFYSQGEPGRPDEDCLRINIWTPGVAKPGHAEKRPVVMWIHGGGFESGSSHESTSYYGENLSRRGNLVFVSINHRLNALGFLNLTAYGPKYASSANVGMLDIVQALSWVRDNITAFGGDPGNVTIMGQSGGGRKVSTLLAMPSAHGLFHKAILHSGSLTKVGLPSETAPVAAATLAKLGLKPGDVDQLQTIPAATLIDAYKAAQETLLTATSTVFDPPYCTPTLDGVIIPTHPFDTAAPAVSAQVPMLAGTTLNEVSPSRFRPNLEDIDDTELKAKVALDYGAKADEVIAVFRRAHPGARPIDIFSMIQSTPPRRAWTLQQAELKAKQGKAPFYNFMFAWHTPMLDGRPRAHHGSDLPLAFANVDQCLHATGGGPEARALEAKMSDAWIAFARTGNPNHSGLPPWPPVSPGTVPTMIFDTVCEVRVNHDLEEVKIATVVPESLRHL